MKRQRQVRLRTDTRTKRLILVFYSVAIFASLIALSVENARSVATYLLPFFLAAAGALFQVLYRRSQALVMKVLREGARISGTVIEVRERQASFLDRSTECTLKLRYEIGGRTLEAWTRNVAPQLAVRRLVPPQNGQSLWLFVHPSHPGTPVVEELCDAQVLRTGTDDPKEPQRSGDVVPSGRKGD